jgi:hypothetical protein
MASQSNIINDIGALTKIPNKILNEIVAKENLCIGSAIHDAILAKEEIAVLNIGIGTLSVELATKQCKFVPSKELKSVIKRSIDEKIDPVEYALEQAIIDKLLHICDEVI